MAKHVFQNEIQCQSVELYGDGVMGVYHVRFLCWEFKTCRIDVMIALYVNDGCECNMSEETDFGKH